MDCTTFNAYGVYLSLNRIMQFGQEIVEDLGLSMGDIPRIDKYWGALAEELGYIIFGSRF